MLITFSHDSLAPKRAHNIAPLATGRRRYNLWASRSREALRRPEVGLNSLLSDVSANLQLIDSIIIIINAVRAFQVGAASFPTDGGSIQETASPSLFLVMQALGHNIRQGKTSPRARLEASERLETPRRL